MSPLTTATVDSLFNIELEALKVWFTYTFFHKHKLGTSYGLVLVLVWSRLSVQETVWTLSFFHGQETL